MKRNLKRLPALLLAIILCLNLLPVTAGATDLTTLIVGGITVVENGTVSSPATGEGWSYDSTTGTLTLDGANITTPCSGDDGKTYGIYADGDLTLMLENASTVESSDAAFNYGVYINGSLTVSGTGSLTAGGSGENSYGVYVADTMTANSGSITGSNTGTSDDDYGDGIYVGNTLTVAGGTVTGSGKSSNYSKNGAGIRVSAGGLTVSGGSVTGTTTGTYGTGIRLETGALTVSGSGSVTGTANGNLGDGIYVGNTMKVSGSGSVEGTANGSKGEGIYVRRGDATVEGGSVTGTASSDGYHGIFVDLGALTVRGGSVTGTAYNEGRNGIHVNNALTVEGGSVAGTANGEKGSGIQVNELTVRGGSVAGTANGENGYGIWVNSGDITITNTPTVTATSKTAGYTVKIRYEDVCQLLVNGNRYEPSATATTFKVTDGKVTEGGETWALDVWVNGEKISDGAGSTVECGDGTAKYDPDTGTLTLTDAAISAGHAINVSGSSVTCGIYAESDLTLVLEGTSTVKGTSGTAINIGVYVEGDLTVSGSGTLTTAETDMGICAEGAMTVESGTVISNGKNYGIFVDRLTVSGSGSVEGTATGSNSCGIRVDTDLMVTGGSVTGTSTSTGSNSCGIMVADVLEVSGSGSVTGEGAKYGVYVSEGVLDVSGSGSVSGTATGSSSDGIRVRFYLAANGGTVNGTGKRAGICLEQGALEVEGGTVTGEGADYGVDVAQKTLTVSGSGSVSGTATGSEGEGIYVYSALTVSGSGTVTGTATGENGWGIDVYEGALKVTGGSVTGTGDSTGIYANSGLTVSGGDVTGTGTGDGSWGIDAALLNMTGGSVTGKGTEAAIVAYDVGEKTAQELIDVLANYVPSGYGAQAVVVQDNGNTFTYASFAETGKKLEYNKDSGFTDAATEITLKAPGAISFPQQFYASINFDASTGYKSFGHVTKSGNEWMTYTEAGDVADRTIYGMESAGGAIFTVEGYKLASGADVGWRELRVYSSDLATFRTIGTVNDFSGRYWIVDTAMDLSGEEPALYGTYNDGYSYICKISLTDGKPSGELKVTGLTSTNDIVYAIAFDEDGKLYAIGADAGDNGGPATLYTIDKANGTATKVGEIKDSSGEKISTNYTQDLAYDYHTGTLYWMENAKEVLYTVDAGNAAATRVGQVKHSDPPYLPQAYSVSAFCILDGTPATSGDTHMVSVIHDKNVTVTDGNDSTAAAVYMLGDNASLTLNIKPDPKLGLWYVKVDGEKIKIEDPMAENTQTINFDGKDHVIEVVSRIPINIEESKWNWDSYRGKTASYYTQHSVHKFYDLPDRFEPDFDAPTTGYTQTLLDEEGQPIGDNERILVGNKYNVHVTHEGTEKYAPLDVTYNDVLNLGKCTEPPGRPVVYGKVGCKQSDLATTSYLQDYYYDDGSMVGTEIYDRIPVTLVWLDPDTTYNQEGYFFARATIYAAKDLDPQLARYYDVDSGNPLTPGCQIDTKIIRSTQVVVLEANDASLIKLEVDGDEGSGTVSGKGVYKNGDTVTVTATVNADAGYEFKGWQENGQIISDADATYTFEADGDRTLTAVFVSDPDYLVKLKIDGEEGCGTVTGAGNYKTDPHQATVKATANPGYYFIGWYAGDNLESTNATHQFTVKQEGITLTAKFGVDYLTKAEQAKAAFANAVGSNTLKWAILENAVDAYNAAEKFVNGGELPTVIENAGARFKALTDYYSGIDALNLSNQNLSSADLAELDFFTGLTELDLSGTSLTDLTGLNSLAATLKTLNLSNNKGVTDLTALKGLTTLEALDISGTGVTTLDSLVPEESGQTFPGYKNLTAQELTLNSIRALAELVEKEDFDGDAVICWDFSSSYLVPDTESNVADVAVIQEKLGDKFDPPTIQASEPEPPPVEPEQPITPITPVTPVVPSGSDEDDDDDGYSVSVPASSSIRGGSITVSPRRADRGDTVTITVKPDEGYELDELTVATRSGSELALTSKGSGRYTFTMPASDVKIQVSFREIAAPVVNPFTDVSSDAYYYDAVLWAVANGVTNGTTATTFSPNVTVTRAQMVTFLWRAHGSPRATGSNPFTDVNAGAYYYDAVLWAVANGITNGTTATTFSPNAPVTRAQAVTFQWRTAGSPAAIGNSFDDVAADAYYYDAVLWAVANGITNGTTATTFSPDTPVSRAQAVTFLYRELA